MPAGRLNPLKLSVITQNRRMNFTGVCVVCVCLSLCVFPSVCVFLFVCVCVFVFLSLLLRLCVCYEPSKKNTTKQQNQKQNTETRAQKRDLIPQARRSKRVDQGLSFERPCNRLPRGFPLQRYYKNKKNQPKTKIKKQKESSF